MTENRNRQPKGVATGGQFAAEGKQEAQGIELQPHGRTVLDIEDTQEIMHSDPDLGEVFVSPRDGGFDLVSERFDSYEDYVPHGVGSGYDYLEDREEVVDAFLADRYPNMDVIEVSEGEYHLGFRSTVDAENITTEEAVASLRQDSGHVQYNADFINHASPGAAALTARLAAYDHARDAGLTHEQAVSDAQVRGSLTETGHSGGVLFTHGDHESLAALSAGMRPGRHHLYTDTAAGTYAVGPDGNGGWLAADDDGGRMISGDTVHGWGDTPAEALDTAMLNRHIDWEVGEGTYGGIGFRGAKLESVKGSDIPAKHGTDYVVDLNIEFVASDAGEDDYESCIASVHPATGEVLFMSDSESGIDRSDEVNDEIREATAAKLEDVRDHLNRAPELTKRARSIMGLPDAGAAPRTETIYMRAGAQAYVPVKVEAEDKTRVIVLRDAKGGRSFLESHNPAADRSMSGSLVDEDGEMWILQDRTYRKVVRSRPGVE
ncbi:hypothetical protein LG293_17645 (plasmid) [Citricoccus nitrophenolicus]